MSSSFRRVALLAAVALCLSVPLAADQATFTPRHIAKLRMASSVAVSPDGTLAAYTLVVPRRPLADEDGGAWTELRVVGPDKRSRPFVTGEVNVGDVQWTPDGRALSFLARRGKDTARSLYVLPIDGGEARRVLAHDTDIAAHSWSPDGTRVAFTAREAASKQRKDLEKKGFNQEIYEEAVLFTRVYIATPEGEEPPRQLDLEGSATTIAWSPVGNRLVVVLAPTPLVDDDLMMRRVHVVDLDSGNAVNLENPGKLGDVAWSADGRHVALVSGADINDPAAGRLLVAPAEGGPLRDVLPGYEGHVGAIEFSGNDTIVFVGNEGVETSVNEVKIDGTGRRTRVAAGSQVFSSLSLADGATGMALLGDTPTHPSEVFLLAAGEASPVRVTDSNPWLAGMRFAKQEVVKWKARDGLELEGILVRPLDEQPGSRYPLILTVHGGPEAHDRNGWKTSYSNPGQFAAAAGYAVFYPNYRGSTGRGVAFSKLSQGDAAGKEFDDLVDAVDHLVNIGLVDTKKVGITGGSYGGYASAWGATYYSARFAASVMFVGISNNISRVGTTDIPNEEYLVHALKKPWENWDFQLKRSPIFYSDRHRTPLLILHGTADPRVSPTQSAELYRHLKQRGQAPVRLVRYPGEGHGNRRAASRLDFSLRMMRWFDHYLKGEGGAPPPYEIDYAEPTDRSKAEPSSGPN